MTKLVINAGAKRVEIKSPVFTVIDATAVAKLTAQTVTYGGVEMINLKDGELADVSPFKGDPRMMHFHMQ